jgi:hypothetical protein
MIEEETTDVARYCNAVYMPLEFCPNLCLTVSKSKI